ncbi:MAG: three-Cys-motif partner protein TcmP [Acidobacteria bacterium]|nr:three-Cys-motif partner protein TcmP [Acidobacteriota bacterium]
MSDNIPEHSAAKVRLLGSYLKRFLSVIANDGFTRQIKIFDLFCGGGIYGSDGEGSPIVILREVEGLYFSRKARSQDSPKIDCHFSDLDATKVENLRNSVQLKNLHAPEFGNITFQCRDYREVVSELTNVLRPDRFVKNFIFIDPYGYKHIKANDIKNLLAKGNVEVLLFLPTQFMYRFDSNGTPEALKDFIEEIIDIKHWRENENVWNFVEQLKDSFRKNLGPSVFVDTFTIQKDPQTVFCLFFFSNHIKGFEKMLEAKWELDNEQGMGWHYSRSQLSSLFEKQRVHPLELKLREFLRGNHKTNGDIYKFTLASGFLPKHAGEVFENLQENGELVVTSKSGGKVRRKAFYLNYKTYRDDHDKVSFKLG